MAQPPQEPPRTMPEKVEIRKDQSLAAQAASPVATMSSHLDPSTHYLASAACTATGAYTYLKLPPASRATAAAQVGFGLLYLLAGRWLDSGHTRAGYDLGAVTSVSMLAWTVPNMATHPTNAVLATVAGMSTVANVIKSWQLRTGRPIEMTEK